MRLKRPRFVTRWMQQSLTFKLVSLLLVVSIALLVGVMYTTNVLYDARSSTLPTTNNLSSDVRAVFEKSYYRADNTEPTIVRVDDAKKLRESKKEFYNNVESGDYLIVYPDKAFLYRLSSQKIISTTDMVQSGEVKP